ncbi:tRNA lysidine(34) synthetase TilS [Candidatus Gracilibacteria bacterium]|nr:tRNA lysidine(34) synthetase TilS [Candidatus Gracilibacteria bacterium]
MQNFSLLPFFEKYLKPDEPFILGCSTGADSIFLLSKILETPYRKNLIAAYFNHHTRCQCEEEAYFLQELGKKEDFIVEIGGYNFSIPQEGPSKSFEEHAREKRYDFFHGLKEKYGARKILLAHHFDDKVETMIFNMLRGTKLTGLINMKEVSGDIYRPLLGLQKKEILAYLAENNILYYEDRSNACNDYTRNYIRNELVSKFENVHPEYHTNIGKLLHYLESVQGYIMSEVNIFLQEGKSFSLKDYLGLSELLQSEVIKELYYKNNSNSTIGLSEGNIAEVQKFLRGKNNKTKKEIHGLGLNKDGDIISVYQVKK